MERVLVIDDDPLLRHGLIDILSENDFSAIGAANGAAGVKLAQTTEPDIILCDVEMPEMSGFRVLEHLQSEPATAGIPFVFLTGEQSPQIRRRGMLLGADDFLTKPCQVDELCETLRMRLRRHRAIVNYCCNAVDPVAADPLALAPAPSTTDAGDLAAIAALQEAECLATALPSALGRNEFSVVYQPQFDVWSGKILGAEALLRWSHPSLGQVPPARFIAVAEASELMREIGSWVLEESLRQFQGQRCVQEPGFRLAINVSTQQLYQDDFAEQVLSQCDRHGIHPHCLEIEITETLFLEHNLQIEHHLRRLKQAGIRITLDDFGTGFASMQQLQQTPCDAIKIDSCFVNNVHAQSASTAAKSAAIVQSMIRLAHMLGMTVVAEGIETNAELKLLQHYNCDLAQGFFLAEPMPCSELLHQLSSPLGKLLPN